MLAIVYGCSKFHQYIYGKPTTIETDHKPLESLFKKPLSKAPQRLQCMMLKVQQYDLTVNYTPGKEMYIADTLSQASQPTASGVEEEFKVHVVVNISDSKVKEFQDATDIDETLCKLREVILKGWPQKRSYLTPELHEYWNYRDELVICDGLLLKGDRLLTPKVLRPEMLERLHGSHLGIEKCIDRAKESLFWPGMNKHIQEKVSTCSVCNRHRNNQPKEPLIPHEVPQRPWQTLAADLFVINQDKYMVLVDYYSKYFELSHLKDGTSETVINCLKQHMARHGIPEELYTDNGPEFVSIAFVKFAKDYQFRHITSSPRFPQSNGMVERTVQTAKKLLKKAYEDRKDPYLAILELRNTPLPGIGLSPMQLLMGRRAKTLIPSKTSLLNPAGYNCGKVQQTLKDKQLEQKRYFDRGSHELTPLKEGDAVRLRWNSAWEPAVLVGKSKGKEPRSYLIKANDKLYRRNRKDILKTAETPHAERTSADMDEQLSRQDGDEADRDTGQHKPEGNIEGPVISRVSGRTITAPRRYIEECK